MAKVKSLDDLDNPVLLQIMVHLDVQSLVAISMVAHRYYELASDKNLWKKHCEDFNVPLENDYNLESVDFRVLYASQYQEDSQTSSCCGCFSFFRKKNRQQNLENRALLRRDQEGNRLKQRFRQRHQYHNNHERNYYHGSFVSDKFMRGQYY